MTPRGLFGLSGSASFVNVCSRAYPAREDMTGIGPGRHHRSLRGGVVWGRPRVPFA